MASVEISLGQGGCSTRSALVTAKSDLKKEGGKKGGGQASQQKKEDGADLETVQEGGRGDVGHEEKGESEGKEDAKPAGGGFAGKSGNLKDAVVAQQNRFGLHDPEGE